MSMPETKTMQTNMEAYAKELQDNIETMNVEFNTKLQDFQKNFNTLTDIAKEMKRRISTTCRPESANSRSAHSRSIEKSRTNSSPRSSRRPRTPSTRSRQLADTSSYSTP